MSGELRLLEKRKGEGRMEITIYLLRAGHKVQQPVTAAVRPEAESRQPRRQRPTEVL